MNGNPSSITCVSPSASRIQPSVLYSRPTSLASGTSNSSPARAFARSIVPSGPNTSFASGLESKIDAVSCFSSANSRDSARRSSRFVSRTRSSASGSGTSMTLSQRTGDSSAYSARVVAGEPSASRTTGANTGDCCCRHVANRSGFVCSVVSSTTHRSISTGTVPVTSRTGASSKRSLSSSRSRSLLTVTPICGACPVSQSPIFSTHCPQ